MVRWLMAIPESIIETHPAESRSLDAAVLTH